jgi:hypothetical protein
MTFWSTNGILYLFSVDLQIQEKHFFPKINAYLNILNQIYISLYSSNKFSSTNGILCVFSLIFKYQEKCLFRFKYFSNKNYLNWWNRGNTVIAFSLCFSYCVLFPLKYSYLRIGILCVFSFNINNRKHVSVL